MIESDSIELWTSPYCFLCDYPIDMKGEKFTVCQLELKDKQGSIILLACECCTKKAVQSKVGKTFWERFQLKNQEVTQ